VSIPSVFHSCGIPAMQCMWFEKCRYSICGGCASENHNYVDLPARVLCRPRNELSASTQIISKRLRGMTVVRTLPCVWPVVIITCEPDGRSPRLVAIRVHLRCICVPLSLHFLYPLQLCSYAGVVGDPQHLCICGIIQLIYSGCALAFCNILCHNLICVRLRCTAICQHLSQQQDCGGTMSKSCPYAAQYECSSEGLPECTSPYYWV